MAEHMLILKLTSPEGEVKYVDRRLPVGLRQDQPGDADPDARGLEGRDGRRRHRLDEVRRGRPPLRDQPRGRLLRRRARTRAHKTNPNAMDDDRARTRSSPTARCTDDGDIWWEGMTGEPPAHAIDWHGNDWTPGLRRRPPRTRTPASRPRPRSARRSRPSGRTRPACRSTPSCSAAAARRSCRSSPRRSTGSTASSSARRCRSETTAAAAGEVGKLRFDPMAMLPFCGYNMADYFAHWLEIGAARRRDSCRGSSTSTGSARTTTASSSGPASARTAACSSGSSAAATARARRSRRRSGCVPGARASSTPRASTSPPRRCDELLARRRRGWSAPQLPQVEEHLARFGDRLPDEITAQLEALRKRLGDA